MEWPTCQIVSSFHWKRASRERAAVTRKQLGEVAGLRAVDPKPGHMTESSVRKIRVHLSRFHAIGVPWSVYFTKFCR